MGKEVLKPVQRSRLGNLRVTVLDLSEVIGNKDPHSFAIDPFIILETVGISGMATRKRKIDGQNLIWLLCDASSVLACRLLGLLALDTRGALVQNQRLPSKVLHKVRDTSMCL